MAQYNNNTSIYSYNIYIPLRRHLLVVAGPVPVVSNCQLVSKFLSDADFLS